MSTAKNTNRSASLTIYTLEQKKRQLYERQKVLLDTFLERNAISKEQYAKSLHDMTVKMGFGKDEAT